MPDTPPPAYSQLDDDPFVDIPAAPVPTQPYGAQPPRTNVASPPPVDYRTLHGYGPGIPAPEDLVQPSGTGKIHIVTAGTEILATRNWGIASNRSQGVPGGCYKSHSTWQMALDYYTECYRDGSVRLVNPRNLSATPRQSASTAARSHSSAPTPAQGDRTMPIYVLSSPAPVTTTPRDRVHTTSDTPNTPVSGDHDLLIFVTSSPPGSPLKKSPETIRRHEKLERIFLKASNKMSPSPSQSEPAAWRDPTPVSIPAAASLRRILSPEVTNDHGSTPPSTPTKSKKALTNSSKPSSPLTTSESSKGKANEVASTDSDVTYHHRPRSSESPCRCGEENKHQPLHDGDIRGYQDPNKLRPSVGRKGVREDDELEATEAVSIQEESNRVLEDAGSRPAEFDLLGDARSQRDGTGETRRMLLWIWVVEGVSNIHSDEPSDDILHAEWAKSRARAHRSQEEVNLVKEEMRRTLKFLDWRSKWWQDKPATWAGVSTQLSEGMRAYAIEQADIQKDLANAFESLWQTPLASFNDDDNEVETQDPDHTRGECLDDDDDGDAEFSEDDAEVEDLGERL